ncbi:MAG TPA: MoxR family ATPase [Nitrososphaerales archaeon]|nr:MoxR family ATPase [Nitrososphaerales archaeon]
MSHEVKQQSALKLLDSVGQAIVGKREVLRLILLAILSNGHVLFEDLPGLAKTLTARSFAQSLGCEFKRIQFTSDLLPADVTGSYVFNRANSTFELRKGPIFCNILLADEINRAPPRTQSALLEAMQERQVTIENDTLKLEKPFIVFATQNPIEYEGTYPLPEAQLDRFLVKTSIGYPTLEEEATILERRSERQSDDVVLDKIVEKPELLEMQKVVELVHIDRDLEKYIAEIVSKTRTHPSVEVGSSPRGSLAIMKLAKSNAWLDARDYVIPDDIKTVAVPALNHRLILTADNWLRGIKPQSIIDEITSKVPVPKINAA